MKNELFSEINNAVTPDKELIEATKRAMKAVSPAPQRSAPPVLRRVLPFAAVFAALVLAAGVALNRLPDKTVPPEGPAVMPGGDGASAGAQTRADTALPPETTSPPTDPDANTALPLEGEASAPASETAAPPTVPDVSETAAPPTVPDANVPSPFEGNAEADPNGSYLSDVTPLLLTDRYYYPSLEAMAADRNVVAVSGTVLSAEPFRWGTGPSGETVLTRAEVRVERCLKGDFTPGQTLTVIEAGGMLEGHIWSYNVYRTSEPGDRVVMFLNAVPADFSAEALGGEPAYSPAGATQGTFLYDGDPNGGYRCSGHFHAIEADPKANTPFQMEDFIAAIQNAG